LIQSCSRHFATCSTSGRASSSSATRRGEGVGERSAARPQAPGVTLRLLLERGGQAISKREIEEETGIDSSKSTMRNALSELRTLGVLDDVDRETVKASDKLFPAGLA
jgi:hypothetical protein